jgi:hypothetical protein
LAIIAAYPVKTMDKLEGVIWLAFYMNIKSLNYEALPKPLEQGKNDFKQWSL